MTDAFLDCAGYGAQSQHPTARMNSSELMYFLGAPLAHVAAYEEVLRVKRRHTGRGRAPLFQ